jgi:hypothetical protein
MKSLIAIDGSDCGDAAVYGGAAAGNAIVVNEWDADTFHRLVSGLELQGYVVRRESYRVTPEMNPETGQIVHLRTVELYRPFPDADESLPE